MTKMRTLGLMALLALSGAVYAEPFHVKVIKQCMANKETVNEAHLARIKNIESNGNPRAQSKVGARGLYQIMPATWAEETRKMYGQELPFDLAFNPNINREVAIHYMDKTINPYLARHLKGWDNLSSEKKQDLIAAGYNGGMGMVVRDKGDFSKMPKETRDYVEKNRRLRGN